jgi:hypothetical protein
MKKFLLGSNLSRKDECKLCYFAGLFEGEGSFGISKSIPKKITRKDGKPTIRHVAKVQMQMIDRKPIEAFSKFFNIPIYKWKKQKNYNGDLTTVYKITVNSQGARRIISAILPYLKSPHKIKGAHLCLKILDLLRGSGHYISPVIMRKREVLWRKSLKNNSNRGVKLHERDNNET